jgi:hypothetical protein
MPTDNNPFGQLLGGLLGESADGELPVADTVLGIIDRVTGPRDGDDASPSIDLGSLLEKIRERREANGGTLFPRRDRTGEGEGDQPPPDRRPLRRLLDRILEEDEEEGQDDPASPTEF